MVENNNGSKVQNLEELDLVMSKLDTGDFVYVPYHPPGSLVAQLYGVIRGCFIQIAELQEANRNRIAALEAIIQQEKEEEHHPEVPIKQETPPPLPIPACYSYFEGDYRDYNIQLKLFQLIFSCLPGLLY